MSRVELKLELVMLGVTDVDRAKAFYADKCGFAVHVDHRAGENFRVVQMDPPGSACSITFGVGVSDATPGATKGLHLVVSDITAVRDELAARGLEISEVRHMKDGVWGPGADPDHTDYNSFADFADPDGNTWVVQEKGYAAQSSNAE
ncbi:catechol 2,3-dioxygenase-like lactoylglutathione lyase family enzyme [Kutzneria buriramensis]|uniref:Catechol 2,3-dioxygenase-like lactoylglutathione lyase family enzyme n=1 Tax=Kutzneria buriramensis TaxID=1045776 RepID=A0A3E0HFW1_9PSEU|nr:catechol 2,3-dioxygenase-like lactoylglutathione lyase family enzyme [Kutzneria buriramensis]